MPHARTRRPRLVPRIAKMTRPRPGANKKDASKAFSYVADTLLSLSGEDNDESPLIRRLKGDIGAPQGELVQDALLLAEAIFRELAEDLEDGQISGPEVSSSLFEVMGDIGEIVEDAAAITP